MDMRKTGTMTKFVDGGMKKESQFIHKVTLSNLQPNTTYFYHVGSSESWSSKFNFKTFPQGSDWSPRIAIYGDMGNDNAISLPYLQEETQRGLYDFIIHVGDFAYDLNSDDGKVGDEFMRQIESVASIVPYMTCPGNHEQAHNFSHYKSRFNMPGNSENLFYSYDVGPIHFISFSTEVYYFLEYGIKSVIYQFEFLEKDLIEANKPENRKLRPWIIVYGHRY